MGKARSATTVECGLFQEMSSGNMYRTYAGIPGPPPPYANQRHKGERVGPGNNPCAGTSWSYARRDSSKQEATETRLVVILTVHNSQ